jgi:hypothetical protein
MDTYGYNICKLTCNGGKWTTCGGGYDMIGTVVGKYLQDMWQDELQAFVVKNQADLVPYGSESLGWKQLPDYYGLFVKQDGNVLLDGGCGLECMLKIAEAIGLTYQKVVNKKGNVDAILLIKESNHD